MPPSDLFVSIIDVLSKRYGWSYSEISENMYWEDVYAMYEYASNMDTLEMNEDLRFNFMLHAGSKKAMDAWQDLPIPFPNKNWKPKPKENKGFGTKVLGQTVKRVKGTPEDTKRYNEVLERMKKHKEKVKQRVQDYYNEQFS